MASGVEKRGDSCSKVAFALERFQERFKDSMVAGNRLEPIGELGRVRFGDGTWI